MLPKLSSAPGLVPPHTTYLRWLRHPPSSSAETNQLKRGPITRRKNGGKSAGLLETLLIHSRECGRADRKIHTRREMSERAPAKHLIPRGIERARARVPPRSAEAALDLVGHTGRECTPVCCACSRVAADLALHVMRRI